MEWSLALHTAVREHGAAPHTCAPQRPDLDRPFADTGLHLRIKERPAPAADDQAGSDADKAELVAFHERADS